MSFTGKACATLLVAVGAAYFTTDHDTTPTTGAPRNAAQVANQLDIPPSYLALYHQAGTVCPAVDWALLAAVGEVETNHGRSPLPGVRDGSNAAGASGPMQFMPATWRTIRQRHADVGSNVYDPAAAIPAAAHLLCDEKARLGSVDEAVFAYNHDSGYVSTVLAQARTYRRDSH